MQACFYVRAVDGRGNSRFVASIRTPVVGRPVEIENWSNFRNEALGFTCGDAIRLHRELTDSGLCAEILDATGEPVQGCYAPPAEPVQAGQEEHPFWGEPAPVLPEGQDAPSEFRSLRPVMRSGFYQIVLPHKRHGKDLLLTSVTLYRLYECIFCDPGFEDLVGTLPPPTEAERPLAEYFVKTRKRLQR